MASYAVIRSKHATLSAGVVDTVTFASEWHAIEVLNRSRDAAHLVYFRCDGAAPTVTGEDAFVVRAGETLALNLFGSGVVKLVSPSSPDYSVTAYAGVPPSARTPALA